MLWNSLKKVFEKKVVLKSIAFIDGDQDVDSAITAYNAFLTDTETHIIRQGGQKDMPRKFKRLQNVNIVSLEGYSKGKEVTDKFIAGMIQKSIDGGGYNEIIVVSSDYDFIDIFKMAMLLNDIDGIKFKLIAPKFSDKFKARVTSNSIEVIGF